MPISNGLALPYTLTDGTVADAVQVMANLTYLLAALNRAALDQGGGAGINLQNVQLHSALDGSSPTDLVTVEQLTAAVAGINLAGYALLNSPAFLNVPTAPTATTGTATNQLATTLFVANALAALNIALYAPLASPTFTGTPQAPTAAPGTNTNQIATMAALAAAFGSGTIGSGYVVLGSLYIQWLSIAPFGPGSTTFTWPKKFPNALFACVPGISSGLTFSGSESCGVTNRTVTGGTAWTNDGSAAPLGVDIIAIGN